MSHCAGRRFPIPAHDYFYDATLGSNTNSGHEDAPLQTVAGFNARTWQPGDRVLFKRGETFAGSTTPVGHGRPGRPIMLGAYGSGAKPILDGSAEDFGLELYSAATSNLIVDNLDISGQSDPSATAALLAYTHHLTVSNCDVHGGAYAMTGFGTASSEVHHITIYDSIFRNANKHGLYLGTDGSNWVTDVAVDDCIFHSNGTDDSAHHGQYFGCTLTARVRNCESYGNSACGFKMNSERALPTLNVVYEGNYSHANNFGFWASDTGVVWRNNLAVANTGYGIELVGDATQSGSNNLFYNNTVVATGDYGCVFIYSASCTGNVFKNNVFVTDRALGTARPVITNSDAMAIAQTWNNNLYAMLSFNDSQMFYTTDNLYTFAQWKALANTPDANGVADSPHFVSSPSTTVDATSAAGQKVLNVAATTGFAPGDTVGIGFLVARAEYGVVDTVQAGVSLTLTVNLTNEHTVAQADPVHKVSYTDCHLTSGSHCIAAGDNTLGIVTDKDNVVRGAAVDIGCYEYV